jgi:hypothetical protein
VERVLDRDGDAEELKFETEDDERAFEEYRAKRIEEMRRCRGQSSFSGVLDIAADSFKREVRDAFGNQASTLNTPYSSYSTLYTSHILYYTLFTQCPPTLCTLPNVPNTPYPKC